MGEAFSSYPNEIQVLETKTLWIRCTINQTGQIQNVDIIRSSGNKRRDAKCIAAIKDLKLEPNMVNGKPASQRVLLELQSED